MLTLVGKNLLFHSVLQVSKNMLIYFSNKETSPSCSPDRSGILLCSEAEQ